MSSTASAVQHHGGVHSDKYIRYMYADSRYCRCDVAGEVGVCSSVIRFIFSYEILLPIKVTMGIVTGLALPLPGNERRSRRC